MSNIRTRIARIGDRDFIIALVPRLTEFELPAWREAKQMNSADEKAISRTLELDPPGATILIAEDEDASPLGFIHLNVATDYFTYEKYGHISDVVVSHDGEGRGVGRALMSAAETWARGLGFRWLTLNVFAENARAISLYEKLEYEKETIKYLKVLNGSENEITAS